MPTVRKKIHREEPARLRIRVRVSFNGMYKGDEATVEDNDRVRGWIAAHYVEEIRGEGETGPGGSDESDSGSEPQGAAGGE